MSAEQMLKDLLENERLGYVKRVGIAPNGEIEWSLTEKGRQYLRTVNMNDGREAGC